MTHPPRQPPPLHALVQSPLLRQSTASRWLSRAAIRRLRERRRASVACVGAEAEPWIAR